MRVFFSGNDDWGLADTDFATRKRTKILDIHQVRLEQPHREKKIMKVLFGAMEDLSEPDAGYALEQLGQFEGVIGVSVNDVHTHLMFIEFDGNLLQRTDIIGYMNQFGVHARSLGC